MENKVTTTIEEMLARIEARKKTLWYKITRPYYIITGGIGDMFDRLKYWLQKKRRGYTDPELWDVGTAVIKYAYPLLKAWRAGGVNGYPCGSSPEKWKEVLRRIEYAMELYLKNDLCKLEYKSPEEYIQYMKDMNEGLRLFGKWLPTMWD